MAQVNDLDSMYAEYRQEFENVYTVYEPEVGFANYKFEEDGIYVQEVYVRPQYRGRKWAERLTDKCISDAEKRYNEHSNNDCKVKKSIHNRRTWRKHDRRKSQSDH